MDRKMHKLAQDLANAVMRWEKVPPISLFKYNMATFIPELAAEAISNADSPFAPY
jgi:hypothetical protein